jgi:hypothetical protein
VTATTQSKSLRMRDPRPADGKLAVALLTPGYRGPNPSDAELETLGFAPTADGAWRHSDGSWVERVPAGQAKFGVANARLNKQPAMVATLVRGTTLDNDRPTLSRKPEAWFQDNTAIGGLDLRERTYGDEVRKLTVAGFVLAKRSKTGDTWVHPDGSWAKIGRWSNTTGWKGYAMAELPKPHPMGPLLTERPTVPESMATCALATLGLINFDDKQRLRDCGFVASGRLWIHPDGSWVKIENDKLSLGWKGYPLAELPYSRDDGWGKNDNS